MADLRWVKKSQGHTLALVDSKGTHHLSIYKTNDKAYEVGTYDNGKLLDDKLTLYTDEKETRRAVADAGYGKYAPALRKLLEKLR